MLKQVISSQKASSYSNHHKSAFEPKKINFFNYQLGILSDKVLLTLRNWLISTKQIPKSGHNKSPKITVWK